MGDCMEVSESEFYTYLDRQTGPIIREVQTLSVGIFAVYRKGSSVIGEYQITNGKRHGFMAKVRVAEAA